MGRLVGIGHFFSETAFAEEKADAAKLRRAKKEDDDGEMVRAEQVHMVRRLQNHCKGHFLRRTIMSRDYKGNVLINLPPYKEIIAIVVLTEREKKIMDERAKQAAAKYVFISGTFMHSFDTKTSPSVIAAANTRRIQTKASYSFIIPLFI